MPTHYQGSRQEKRALDAYVKLSRAAATVSARLDRLLSRRGRGEGGGMTTSQLGVLEAVLHLGPMSQCDLARKILKSNGNMTTVIDNLERDNLVRRERSREDRRVLVIHLTPKGTALIERIFPLHVEHMTLAMGQLTAKEQELLSTLCRKLGLAVANLAEN